MNYDFKQKDHWRRRMWNFIAKSVPENPRDAVVLYFAAEQDLDRPIARRLGFSEHNMIAVERDSGVAETLRSRGVLTVNASLDSVLINWPCHTPISCVFGDFMCGIGDDTYGTAVIAMHHAKGVHSRAVLAFNLLRGRDPKNPWIRPENIKHRGKQLLVGLAVRQLVLDNGEELYLSASVDERERAIRRLISDISFIDHSYKSGPQFFDSVAFVKPATRVTEFQKCQCAETKRQIAAILAHRTRRIAA